MDSSSKIEIVCSEINFLELNYIKLKKKRNLYNFSLNLRFFLYSYSQFLNLNFILPNFIGGKILVIMWIINTCDLNGIKLSNITKKYLTLKLNSNKFKNFCYENLLCEKLSLPVYYTLVSLVSLIKQNKNFLQKQRIYFYFIFQKLCKKLYENNFDQNELLDFRIIYSYLFINSLYDFFNNNSIMIIKNRVFLHINSSYYFLFEKKNEYHASLEYCLISSIFFIFTSKGNINIKPQFFKCLNYYRNMFNFGFSGRINKSMDTCYFFWFLAVSVIINFNCTSFLDNLLFFFSSTRINAFCDKIGKKPDIYHTYYSNLCKSIYNFIIFSKNNHKIDTQNKSTLFSKINPIYMFRESILFYNFCILTIS